MRCPRRSSGASSTVSRRDANTRIPTRHLFHNTENPALRARLGSARRERVVVTQVDYGSSAWGHVQQDDVLLEIDGLQIGGDGTVAIRDRFRTAYCVVYGDHFVGDEIELACSVEASALRAEWS